jgi:hypothetical protein
MNPECVVEDRLRVESVLCPVPSKAQGLRGRSVGGPQCRLALAAVPDLGSDKSLVIQRPRQPFLADFENALRQRRVGSGRRKLLHDLPLKGNPDMQLGDLAVRPLEPGIPVAQPRTLSIQVTTGDSPSGDESRHHRKPTAAHGVRFKVMRRFANRQRVGKWQRRHSASGCYWQFLRRPLKFACRFASTVITVASSEGNLKEAAVIETSRIAKSPQRECITLDRTRCSRVDNFALALHASYVERTTRPDSPRNEITCRTLGCSIRWIVTMNFRRLPARGDSGS